MKKSWWLAIGVALGSLALFWLPFLIRINRFWGIGFRQNNMETIVQNFDGLNYLVVAKSWYNPDEIQAINQSFLTGNHPLYFTAHYPAFPLMIKLFDWWLTGPQAMLASIVLSNLILVSGLWLFFHQLIKNRQVALSLTLLALFIPARMLADRSVGSNEPLFMGLTLGSLYLAQKKKYWWSAIVGSLAIMTRSPGILLFGGYLMAIWLDGKSELKVKFRRTLPYLLMPLSLILVWAFYGYQYHNWLAYFHSGVSMNLHFPPFLVFGTEQSWISGMWREEIIYIYLLFGAGLVSWGQRVWREKQWTKLAVWWYGMIYWVSIMFVAHRDVARYSLPMAPIVWLGMQDVLKNRWIKWLLWGLIVPIYLLSWQFVLQNVQPVANWSGLL